MAKTYNQYVADCQADMESEGYEQDISVYTDIAESMLHMPEFRALAEREFGVHDRARLAECVAHSLC